MTMKASKILMAAADLLQAGWCQKYLGIRDKASCWQAAKYYGLPILFTAAHQFQPGVEVDDLCLQGAIMKAAVDLAGVGWPVVEGNATPDQEDMRASYRAAEHQVADEIASRTGSGGTARWNDVVGRTQAEVVALVQDVAALMEAAEQEKREPEEEHPRRLDPRDDHQDPVRPRDVHPGTPHPGLPGPGLAAVRVERRGLPTMRSRHHRPRRPRARLHAAGQRRPQQPGPYPVSTRSPTCERDHHTSTVAPPVTLLE